MSKNTAEVSETVKRLTTTVALSTFGLLALTTGPGFADPSKKVVHLRGSNDAVVSPLRTDSSGGQIEYVIPADTDLSGETTYAVDDDRSFLGVTETGRGIAELATYTMRTGIDAVLLRETDNPSDTHASLLNSGDNARLRQSMLHSSNYDPGLRSGSAEIADTVSATLRGSYATRARLERAKADKAREMGALGNFLPNASLTVDGNKSMSNTLSSQRLREESIDATINVTVPIFTSGANLATYRQSKHVARSSEYSFLAEEHRQALDAISAHINLRLNRRVEQALRKNVTAMRQILSVAQRLFDAGDASRTDIEIARANVESALSEVENARRSREQSLADYKNLTGNAAPKRLNVGKLESLVPSSVDEAVNSALANNPSLLAAQETALAAVENAKAVRGRFGPQISGFGQYDRSLYNSSDTDQKPEWSVGVRLQMPLVDFAALPQINTARYEASEAEYTALDTGRQIRRQLERQWASYHSAKRRVGIIKRQLNAVSASIDGVRREYEAGFRSITDVLNDQIRLVRAQITLEQTRHEKYFAAYELAFTSAHEGVKHIALAR